MEHKQFIEELQSRLGKDKKEIDNLFSDMLQILKDRCGQIHCLYKDSGLLSLGKKWNGYQ